MRIWLHTSTKSMAFGPGGVVSLVAHAAIIGGAVYGTGRASVALQQQAAERVYFLPPPDRSPGSRPAVQHVRYVAAGAGEPRDATARTGTLRAGGGGELAEARRAHAGADATTQRPQVARASNDSVYSILTVEESATRVEGSGAPAYPPALLAQHIEGTVRARYVIDSTGHTDPLSIDILASTQPGFVQAVRDAIPLMRFTPAMVAGHAVRQLVEQDFSFRIVAPAPVAADNTRAVPPA